MRHKKINPNVELEKRLAKIGLEYEEELSLLKDKYRKLIKEESEKFRLKEEEKQND